MKPEPWFASLGGGPGVTQAAQGRVAPGNAASDSCMWQLRKLRQDGVRDGVTPGSVALPACGAPTGAVWEVASWGRVMEGWPAAPSGV